MLKSKAVGDLFEMVEVKVTKEVGPTPKPLNDNTGQSSTRLEAGPEGKQLSKDSGNTETKGFGCQGSDSGALLSLCFSLPGVC